MPPMKHLLIIDDELGTRESLRMIFNRDYRVTVVSSGKAGMDVLVKDRPDLILLDVLLDDFNGMDLLREVRSRYVNLPVIIVSAVTAVPKVVEAIQNGAYDYIAKPFDVADIMRLVKRALENSTLKSQVEALRDEVTREFPVDGIVGKAAEFQEALAEINKAAKTDSTVLICGESGTGKELATRMLHRLSSRSNEPFVAVHCAGIPETLIESGLFGHEKGAFTNAYTQKTGRFDMAGSGTLFFDEVSEMSLAVQAKLLRVIEEREYVRVGGNKVIKTNARIVAACNKDLRQLVGENKFREDLYYRLSVVPITLPPLRVREGDVQLLACFFLDRFRQDMNLETNEISAEALQILCEYEWPGNVRELRNVIERMLVLHGNNPVLNPEHLPRDLQNGHVGGPAPQVIKSVNAGASLSEALESHEKLLIEQALQETRGNQSKAAEILGTTRRILKYRMEKFELDSKAFQ